MVVSSKHLSSSKEQSLSGGPQVSGKPQFHQPALSPTRLSTWEQLTLMETAKVTRVLRRIARRFSVTSLSELMSEPNHQRLRSALSFYQREQFENRPKVFFKTPQGPPNVCLSSPHQLSRGKVLDLNFPSEFKPSYVPFRKEFESCQQNKHVFARMWKHPQDTNLGTIIAIHGWLMGDRRLSAVTLVPGYFFKLGLNVVLFELPYHGRRNPQQQRNLSLFPSSHLARTNEGFAQAIFELRSLVQWLEIEDKRPIGVIGFSLGAYVAELWASLDRLSFAICAAPLVSLAEAGWEMIRDPIVDRGNVESRDLQDITLKDLKKAYAVHCPLTYQPKVEHSRRMILASTSDDLVPHTHPQELWQHWGKPKIQWVSGQHVDQILDAQTLDHVHSFLLSLGLAHAKPLEIQDSQVRNKQIARATP